MLGVASFIHQVSDEITISTFLVDVHRSVGGSAAVPGACLYLPFAFFSVDVLLKILSPAAARVNSILQSMQRTLISSKYYRNWHSV